MTQTLAIVAPILGARSETFIRRHMEDLLPGKTVVIAMTADEPDGGYWDLDCPTLILNRLQIQQSAWHRGLNFLAKKAGIRSPEDHRSQVSKAIEHFLQKHNVKVILGEYLSHSFPFLSISQKLGISYFTHAHGEDISAHLRAHKWRKSYLDYNQSAGIITINQVSQKRLIEIGINPSMIHLIPYGISVPDKPLQRNGREVVRCIAVGRMTPKKAPILLLDAFRRATEEYPNLKLDYIGTGELLPAVKQFIQAFNLHDRVVLHGGQPNDFVQHLMQDSDIFLQHSITDPDTGDEEGLPVAILEAMGNSLPVISTRHAGIPEAVLEQETGLLVDEGNSYEMAKQIICLATNQDLRLKMGLMGWQRAREFFTWEREKDKLIQVMSLES